MNAERVADRDSEVVRIQASLALHRQRVDQELAAHGPPNNIDACRFSADDVRRIAEVMGDKDGQACSTRVARAAEYEAPAAPPADACRLLEEVGSQLKFPDPVCPWWQTLVSSYRELFAGVAVFKVEDGPCEVAFYHLFSMQQPKVGVYLELRSMGRGLCEQDFQDVVGFGVAPEHYKEFSFMPARFFLAHELNFDEESDSLAVLRDLQFQGGTVVSCHLPEPFEDYIAPSMKPAKQKRQTEPRQRNSAKPPNFEEKLRAEYPWLTDADFAGLHRTRRSSGKVPEKKGRNDSEDQEDEEHGGPSSDSESGAASERDPFGSEDDEVPGELALIREAWAEKSEEDMAFYCRVLGGKWTMRNKGVVADAVSAFARGGMCKSIFCHNYGWPAQFTCTYAKFGMESAHALCREFCRRGDYFFSIWAAQPDDRFQFSEEDIQSYEETLEWVTFLTEADTDGPVFQRGLEIRELVPTNPDPEDFE